MKLEGISTKCIYLNSICEEPECFRISFLLTNRMDRETYLFHQTPAECAKDLIAFLDIAPTDILYEPFKGEGAFYNNFPTANPKLWAELEQGVDYRDVSGAYDWVITNPPFKLDTGKKQVNSFYFLLDYFLQRANKGVAFLGNDACLATLTPKRLNEIHRRGWYLSKIVVCNIKKWRGRYFFVVFTKTPNNFYNFLLTSY